MSTKGKNDPLEICYEKNEKQKREREKDIKNIEKMKTEKVRSLGQFPKGLDCVVEIS